MVWMDALSATLAIRMDAFGDLMAIVVVAGEVMVVMVLQLLWFLRGRELNVLASRAGYWLRLVLSSTEHAGFYWLLLL